MTKITIEATHKLKVYGIQCITGEYGDVMYSDVVFYLDERQRDEHLKMLKWLVERTVENMNLHPGLSDFTPDGEYIGKAGDRREWYINPELFDWDEEFATFLREIDLDNWEEHNRSYGVPEYVKYDIEVEHTPVRT